MNRSALERALAELPLFAYFFLEPKELVFSERVRAVCRAECPMYGRSWACPPAVGEVADCAARCRSYDRCLLIGTVAEGVDTADLEASLATRAPHEALTNRVRDILRELGAQPYVLSSEACAVCSRCAILDGLPCRMPGRMHPCVESHGILLTDTLERCGVPFHLSADTVTWYSLLFYDEEVPT